MPTPFIKGYTSFLQGQFKHWGSDFLLHHVDQKQLLLTFLPNEYYIYWLRHGHSGVTTYIYALTLDIFYAITPEYLCLNQSI